MSGKDYDDQYPMPSDEKPLQAWYCYDREEGDAFAEHWPPDPRYFPLDETTRWYNADEADQALAAKDARIAELEALTVTITMEERTGITDEEVVSLMPADSPVTRRELAYLLWVICGLEGVDGRSVTELGNAASRLERGEDARGGL